jgi:hypothetical protein
LGNYQHGNNNQGKSLSNLDPARRVILSSNKFTGTLPAAWGLDTRREVIGLQTSIM